MIPNDFQCRALESVKYDRCYKGFLHAPEAWKSWISVFSLKSMDSIDHRCRVLKSTKYSMSYNVFLHARYVGQGLKILALENFL